MKLKVAQPGVHPDKHEWAAIFDKLLNRCGGVCEARTEACLAPADGRLERLTRSQVSVQHRRARGAGGTSLEATHFLDNLLLLCGTGTTGCHGWVETQERAAGVAMGFVLPHSYDDGRPVQAWRYPVRIWGGRWRVLHPFYADYEPVPSHLQHAVEAPVILTGPDRY